MPKKHITVVSPETFNHELLEFAADHLESLVNNGVAPCIEQLRSCSKQMEEDLARNGSLGYGHAALAPENLQLCAALLSAACIIRAEEGNEEGAETYGTCAAMVMRLVRVLKQARANPVEPVES